ncbi:hypothetical protein LCM08_00540 [Salipiger pacificus]|nr:hypothetical protein [Alloyangia pacifica]
MNLPERNDSWTEHWAPMEALLGRVVTDWGQTMALLYNLPDALGLEKAEKLQGRLAWMTGDHARIQCLLDIIEHSPLSLENADSEKRALVAQALCKLKRLAGLRDALVHGLPVVSFKRDIVDGSVIRRGTYLVQSRGKTEDARYLKLPEAGEDFIVQLAEVKASLFDVVHEVSIEAWRAFTAEQPAERHEEPETTFDRPPPITT